MYGHGGSDNHGAEAIVKMTISLLRSKYPDAYIAISSHYPEQDKAFGIDANEFYAPDLEAWEKEKSVQDIDERMKYARKMYQSALQAITSDTILISVGGDNYCYQNWHRLAVFQEEAQKRNAKSILWGASIEPSEISAKMARVLNTYTHILVRESITYHALIEKGIASDIQLIPDIAFSLLPKSVSVPSQNYVGINISPLIIRKEKKTGVIFESVHRLIHYILEEEGLEVVLIPHVTVKADNDYEALQMVYEDLPDCQKTRIHLIDKNLSAAEYKSIIARCQALVCSRTHASIAAYSSNVPTLVLGYSVKATGIASDLNVLETVLDIDTICDSSTVVHLFREIFAKREAYRSYLSEILPEYIAKIAQYRNYV